MSHYIYTVTNAKDTIYKTIAWGESQLATILGELDEVKIIPPRIEHLKETAKYALETLYSMRDFVNALQDNKVSPINILPGDSHSAWITNGQQSGQLRQVIADSLAEINSWLRRNDVNPSARYTSMLGSGVRNTMFQHYSHKRKAGGVKVSAGALGIDYGYLIPTKGSVMAKANSYKTQQKTYLSTNADDNFNLAKSLNGPPPDDGWRLAPADCESLKPPVWDKSEESWGAYNRCVSNNQYLQQKGYIGLKGWENQMRLDLGDDVFDNDPVAKVEWLRQHNMLPKSIDELKQDAQDLINQAEDHNRVADNITSVDQKINYDQSKLRSDRIWEGLGMGAKIAAMILTLPVIGFSGPIALGINAAALGIQSITDAAQGKSASSIGEKWANFAIDQAKSAATGAILSKVQPIVNKGLDKVGSVIGKIADKAADVSVPSINFDNISFGGHIKRQRMLYNERRFKKSIRRSVK